MTKYYDYEVNFKILMTTSIYVSSPSEYEKWILECLPPVLPILLKKCLPLCMFVYLNDWRDIINVHYLIVLASQVIAW
jgi:hypothetical protein